MWFDVNSDNNTSNYERRFNVNTDRRLDNAARMIPERTTGMRVTMKTYKNLYSKLCSYENLELAWKKARKRKTLKDYVIEFESNLEDNLLQLKWELETLAYSPVQLTTFIIRDPKTRKISASHFRDKVVHHALCNIIEPILGKDFIYDSFANQKGKGVHLAVRRFRYFMNKFSDFDSSGVGRGGGGNVNFLGQKLCMDTF